MAKLKQNNLSEATTENGFCGVINTNAGETIVSLTRIVTLDDGTEVKVEGITPAKMKTILNSKLEEGEITYKTPGENVGDIKGICQVYNAESEATNDEDDIDVTNEETDEEETDDTDITNI